MKAIVALILGILLLGCAQSGDTTQGSTTETQGSGRVIFGITDAAADMGAVSSIQVTVESVSLRSEADAWTSIDIEPQTFDLLQLKAESMTAVLADANVSSGNYTELRLQISDVIVVDDQGEHDAKLPSNELKFKGNVSIEENSTSTAVFDFIADESLHVTGNGQYILTPVVQLETREDTDVEVESDGRLTITGGRVNTNARFGMDVAGNIGVNIRVPADAQINIDGGNIRIGGRNSSNTSAGVGVGVDAGNAGIGAQGGIQITAE